MVLKEYSFGYWDKSDLTGKYHFIDNNGKTVYTADYIKHFNCGFVIPFVFSQPERNNVSVSYGTDRDNQNAVIHYKDAIMLLQDVNCNDITLYDDNLILVKNQNGISKLLEYDEPSQVIKELISGEDIYYIDSNHFGLYRDGVHHLLKGYILSALDDKRVFNMIPYGSHPLSIEEGKLITILPDGEKIFISEI